MPMIPGAFEIRVKRAQDASKTEPVPTAARSARAASPHDRARLDRELEGGGAPHERKLKQKTEQRNGS